MDMQSMPSAQMSVLTIEPVGDGTYTISAQLRNSYGGVASDGVRVIHKAIEQEGQEVVPIAVLTNSSWVYSQNFDPSAFTPAAVRFSIYLDDGEISVDLPEA